MAKKTTRKASVKKKAKSKSKTVSKSTKAKNKLLPSRFYNIKNPVEVSKMILQFKNFVEDYKCIVLYEGKPHVTISGWQFAGSLLGLRSKVKNVRKESAPAGELIYRAEVVLYDVAGKPLMEDAVMYCSSTEGYPTHSNCSSMAQTRALSKAYRMCLGWIIQAAGFELTPAEEMGAKAPGTADLTADNFKQLFAHCEIVDEVVEVHNANKKLHNNHLYKNAMTEAGARCRQNESQTA